MTIWCFAQGAFGITTALFCFVFPFACSRCGIPTGCPTRFSSLPYTALCVTSHLSPPPQTIFFSLVAFLSSGAMTGINVYHVVKYGQNMSGSWKIPAAVIGGPAVVCAFFLIVLITNSCAKGQVRRKRMQTEL